MQPLIRLPGRRLFHKIPFQADAAALLEHMAAAVGETVTLLALHGARTVQQPCDPAHFLVRVPTPPGKSWIFFLKIPGPGKSWKISLVLESPGN